MEEAAALPIDKGVGALFEASVQFQNQNWQWSRNAVLD
jgi:hypothetical protein